MGGVTAFWELWEEFRNWSKSKSVTCTEYSKMMAEIWPPWKVRSKLSLGLNQVSHWLLLPVLISSLSTHRKLHLTVRPCWRGFDTACLSDDLLLQGSQQELLPLKTTTASGEGKLLNIKWTEKTEKLCVIIYAFTLLYPILYCTSESTKSLLRVWIQLPDLNPFPLPCVKVLLALGCCALTQHPRAEDNK